MSIPTLYQIIPILQPEMDNVGEYAFNLAIQLRERHEVQSSFIVCDPEYSGPSQVEGFIVRRLRRRNEAGIWCLLAASKNPRSAALLHYTSYGYDKFGVPSWLYRGIKSWLAENTREPSNRSKLFSTVFHELWGATAKPWKRAFYMQRLQRGVIARFHRCSKIAVANTLQTKRMLDEMEGGKKTLWLPAPSSVPVGNGTRSGPRRIDKFRIAIFGQPSARTATVRAHANLLRTLDQKRTLTSVTLMGKGHRCPPTASEVSLVQKSVSHAPIQVMGELSPRDVSRSLESADLFLSHHRGESACKSDALMAAFAASCPSVLRDGENAAPLRESEHFIASDDSPESVQRFERKAAEGHLDRIATAGRLWYDQYADWEVVAQQFREALCQEDSSPDETRQKAQRVRNCTPVP